MNKLIENLIFPSFFIAGFLFIAYLSYKYQVIKSITYILLCALLNWSFYNDFVIKSPTGLFLVVFILLNLWLNLSLYLFMYKNSYKQLSYRICYIFCLLVVKALNLNYLEISEDFFVEEINSNSIYLFLNYLIFITKNYSFLELLFLLVPGVLSINVYLESKHMPVYMMKNSSNAMDGLITKMRQQCISPQKIVLPQVEILNSEVLKKTAPMSIIYFDPLVKGNLINQSFPFKSLGNGFFKYFDTILRNKEQVNLLQQQFKNFDEIQKESYNFYKLMLPFVHQLNFNQIEMSLKQVYPGISEAFSHELLKSLQYNSIVEKGLKIHNSQIGIEQSILRLQGDTAIYQEIASLRGRSLLNTIRIAETLSANLLAVDSVLKEECIEIQEIIKSTYDLNIISKRGEKIKFEVKNIYHIYNKDEFEDYIKGVFSKYDSDSGSKKLIIALDDSLTPTDKMEQVVEVSNSRVTDENMKLYMKKV